MIFPIDMYEICSKDLFVDAICETCKDLDCADPNCSLCKGKGTYKKVIHKWEVSNNLVRVYNIDRDYNSCITPSSLRYWITFGQYVDESDRLLHFSKEDAQKECDYRNMLTQSINDLLGSNHLSAEKCIHHIIKKEE